MLAGSVEIAGWAASHFERRLGSLRCILLPWCTGIRPKPLAGNGTGDSSSSGSAKKKRFTSGVYFPGMSTPVLALHVTGLPLTSLLKTTPIIGYL